MTWWREMSRPEKARTLLGIVAVVFFALMGGMILHSLYTDSPAAATMLPDGSYVLRPGRVADFAGRGITVQLHSVTEVAALRALCGSGLETHTVRAGDVITLCGHTTMNVLDTDPQKGILFTLSKE